ncbi:MAG: glycoside hydrolase family 3 C-terminal domain-containing protein [Burkholderiales bacterium]|nr:glycoside hydrolase family 3 C-terminal domain-containing protein [Burkholderiales bacterium]
MACATLVAQVGHAADAAPHPWMERALGADQRVALLLPQMSQAEKLLLVYGYFGQDSAKSKKIPEALPQSAGYVPGIPRLGIPAQFLTDAGLGVASQPGPQPRERTALASNMATAASWDLDLAYRGSAMIGAEARASGFNVMLAGGVNLVREPRNGRNFEYAGEDPLLAGRIVGQEVKGVQSNHIVSTLKHFLMNDQETGRNFANVIIDDAAARMSDLLAMQLANEIGDPGSVMCAYNLVNGVYACESDYLLNEVLKGDWRYQGYVMSDWGATHSTVAAANHGLDQDSGSDAFDNAPYFAAPLKAAVEQGSVAQSRIDDMARRILRALFDKGVFDHPVAADGKIDFVAHGLVSQHGAEQGMVLLKNSRGLLPLAAGARTIAVIGGHADVGVLSGGGSSKVYPIGGMAVAGLQPANWPGPVIYFPSSPLQAIKAHAPQAKLSYLDGRDLAAASALAASADVVLVFANQWVGEALDASSLALPDDQDALIAAVAAANPNTVVVLQNSGPVTMPWLAQAGAVLEAWYPGTNGGAAIANVLFGTVNPSGHLPVTFPQSENQLPRPKLDGDPAQPEARFDVHYHEGATVGYKWFDAKGLTPLFPFGHGLSYTQFARSGLRVEHRKGVLRAHFTVTNTGKLRGKTVPQLYVAAPGWEAPKRLAGWAKLDLAPGQSKQVDVDIEPRILAMFDSASKNWRIAPGKVEVILAESAADPHASKVSIQLNGALLDVTGKLRK